MRRQILAAVALLVAAGCSDRLLFAPVDGFAHHEPDARYEQVFPHYVELCAFSQFRSEELTGGSPGHAVMYLKGACRDTDAPYPRLRRCTREVSDPNDSEHGAGISVNRWFRSVNWVAFSGRDAFYEGNRNPDEVVTRDLLAEVSKEQVDAGVYRGVELWPYPTQTPDSTMLDFVSKHSAGTDFALQFARSAICGRVPLQPEMLDEVIEFLNELNRKFATGVADFQWSGYHDNCVHTLRNALAAASIWSPTSVATTKLRQLFNLAIPANEALNLAALGTMGPLDSYREIFRDEAMRNALLEFAWLPTRQGSVLVSLRAHAANEVFDPNPRLLVLQSPITVRRTRKLLEMLEDPRFTELDANLAHFATAYREILAGPPPTDVFAALRGDRYRRFRRRYVSVIEAQLRDVESIQSRLGGAGRPVPAPVEPTH